MTRTVANATTSTVTADTRHLTASAAVFDPANRRVLLVDHRGTGQRQLPGGHVKDDETPDQTAYREVFEETGIRPYLHAPDTSPIPGGVRHPAPIMVVEFDAPAKPTRGEPAHRHIDLLFVAVADSTVPVTPNAAEVDAAVWLSVDVIGEYTARWDVPAVVKAAWAHLTGETL